MRSTKTRFGRIAGPGPHKAVLPATAFMIRGISMIKSDAWHESHYGRFHRERGQVGGQMTYDLILRGGRVVDPSQKLDAVADVAFSQGKVARIGPRLQADPGPDFA